MSLSKRKSLSSQIIKPSSGLLLILLLLLGVFSSIQHTDPTLAQNNDPDTDNDPYDEKPFPNEGRYYSWNLLHNGGFEMVPAKWNSLGSVTLTTSSIDPYSGINSLALLNRNSPNDGILQDVSATLSQEGEGLYWIGAAFRVSAGTDIVEIKLTSGNQTISIEQEIDTEWTYVYGTGTLNSIDSSSQLIISTKNSSRDLYIDEILLRKQEDLSNYNFNYPATYPALQTFRQTNEEELSYFPIIYDVFSSKSLKNLKESDPSKMVVGQSNWGAAIEWGELSIQDEYPYEMRGTFFPGWYAYLVGTDLSQAVSTNANQITVAIPDNLRLARNGNYFDAAIIARNNDGTPNWNKVEHVTISAISGNQVTIGRGDFNSPVHSFSEADNAYIAQKFGWLDQHDNWMWNLSLVAPRDPLTGMNGADFFAYYYKDFFVDNPHLDGLQFDVSNWLPASFTEENFIDANNDGIADRGTFNGVNTFGLGIQEMLQQMRSNIGEDKILTYDLEDVTQARTHKFIDGANFEAPFIDEKVIGREFSWMEHMNETINDRPIRYSYLQQVPNNSLSSDFIEYNFGRIGIVASAMLEVPYANEVDRTSDVIFWRDEYFGGEDINVQGWLGEAVGPIVYSNHFNPNDNILKDTVWGIDLEEGYQANYAFNNNTHTINVTETLGDPRGATLKSNFLASTLNSGETYTFVFEARGGDDFEFGGNVYENVPRAMTIFRAGMPANNPIFFASIGETLTDEWRNYAISYPASESTSLFGVIEIGLSEMAGITEIRNIQLYKGSHHIMMREFENGIALINGSEAPFTFDLPDHVNYRRINGIYTPDVNNGEAINGHSITIPAWDALFLVKDVPLTIEASSTSEGSISPNGSIIANKGSSKKFIIEPNENHLIKDVYVDCVSQGSITEYIFSNIQSPHQIHADFYEVSYPYSTITNLFYSGERLEVINNPDKTLNLSNGETTDSVLWELVDAGNNSFYIESGRFPGYRLVGSDNAVTLIENASDDFAKWSYIDQAKIQNVGTGSNLRADDGGTGFSLSQDTGSRVSWTISQSDVHVIVKNEIAGGDSADTLVGTEKSDLLLGNNGNDLLQGGNDDDTLNGGTGQDILEGGEGENILIGGADADQFIASLKTYNCPLPDYISDFEDGIDKINLRAWNTPFEALTIKASGENDTEISFENQIIILNNVDVLDISRTDFVLPNVGPTIVTNNIGTLNEGGELTISSSLLSVFDPDDNSADLVYDLVSSPQNGFVFHVDQPQTAITQFTQFDLDQNRIKYKHDSSDTVTDSFDFSVADGGEDGVLPASGTFEFNITPVDDPNLNDKPAVLTNVSPTIVEGGSFVLNTANLSAIDVDNDPSELIFIIVSPPQNGTLFWVDNNQPVSGTFSQDDIENNRIIYVHDDSDTILDRFEFKLTDGIINADDQVEAEFSINISPKYEVYISFIAR